MKLFTLKAVGIVLLMFVSVLFGMQQASNGIIKMKGYEDENFQSAVTIKENNTGNVEASILGKNVSSHDIEQKKERLEEMQAYNFFSDLGKMVATTFSGLADIVIEFANGIIK